jgi:hypothetical protein
MGSPSTLQTLPGPIVGKAPGHSPSRVLVAEAGLPVAQRRVARERAARAGAAHARVHGLLVRLVVAHGGGLAVLVPHALAARRAGAEAVSIYTGSWWHVPVATTASYVHNLARPPGVLCPDRPSFVHPSACTDPAYLVVQEFAHIGVIQPRLVILLVLDVHRVVLLVLAALHLCTARKAVRIEPISLRGGQPLFSRRGCRERNTKYELPALNVNKQGWVVALKGWVVSPAPPGFAAHETRPPSCATAVAPPCPSSPARERSECMRVRERMRTCARARERESE